MNNADVIVTQGPYSSFLDEVVREDIVQGVRLNTVMPIKEGEIRRKLKELHERIYPKTLWIDLKARQLRVTDFANTPYTAVSISHKIHVNLPAIVYFDNGNITAKLVEIDGTRLILEDYAGRLIGPGESVNIIDPSLKYLEPSFLTERDKGFVDVSRDLHIGHFMLSFAESAADVEFLKKLYPDCVVMAKIESKKGMDSLESIAGSCGWIMAARGDLYTELDYPHEIGPALKRIVSVAGEKAVAASRMFNSLLKHPVPSCPDMMDLLFLKDMQYRHFMIGDDICFRKEMLFQALRIMKAIFR